MNTPYTACIMVHPVCKISRNFTSLVQMAIDLLQMTYICTNCNSELILQYLFMMRNPLYLIPVYTASTPASAPVDGTRKTPRKRKRAPDKNQSTEEEEGGASSVRTPAPTRRATQKTKQGAEEKRRRSEGTSAEPKQVKKGVF